MSRGSLLLVLGSVLLVRDVSGRQPPPPAYPTACGWCSGKQMPCSEYLSGRTCAEVEALGFGCDCTGCDCTTPPSPPSTRPPPSPALTAGATDSSTPVLNAVANPLATIMVLTCNRPKYVLLALRQIADQDYRPLEALVVDDGSVNLETRLRAAHPNLEVTRQGAAATLTTSAPPEEAPSVGGLAVRLFTMSQRASIGEKRTAAVHAARGDVILHWDDDDFHEPMRVGVQIAPIVRGDAELTALELTFVASLPRFKVYEMTKPGVETILWSSLAYRSSLGRELGFANVSLAEDIHFADLAVHNCHRMEVVSGVQSIYTRHEGAGMSNTYRAFSVTKMLRDEVMRTSSPPEWLTPELMVGARGAESESTEAACTVVARHRPHEFDSVLSVAPWMAPHCCANHADTGCVRPGDEESRLRHSRRLNYDESPPAPPPSPPPPSPPGTCGWCSYHQVPCSQYLEAYQGDCQRLETQLGGCDCTGCDCVNEPPSAPSPPSPPPTSSVSAVQSEKCREHAAACPLPTTHADCDAVHNGQCFVKYSAFTLEEVCGVPTGKAAFVRRGSCEGVSDECYTCSATDSYTTDWPRSWSNLSVSTTFSSIAECAEIATRAERDDSPCFPSRTLCLDFAPWSMEVPQDRAQDRVDAFGSGPSKNGTVFAEPGLYMYVRLDYDDCDCTSPYFSLDPNSSTLTEGACARSCWAASSSSFASSAYAGTGTSSAARMRSRQERAGTPYVDDA